MAGYDALFGFDTTQKQTLERYLGDLGLSEEQQAAVAALVALTNNSGGTADNTVAAMPAATAVAGGGAVTDAASLASVNVSITAIRNNIADLTVKINAIIEALKL